MSLRSFLSVAISEIEFEQTGVRSASASGQFPPAPFFDLNRDHSSCPVSENEFVTRSLSKQSSTIFQGKQK
jgi:hypothetical protein